jgi:hypothetical protein
VGRAGRTGAEAPTEAARAQVAEAVALIEAAGL